MRPIPIPSWDDPIWYREDGRLHKLNHLWYSSERVKEAVLARLSDDEIPKARRWHDIRTGTSKFTSAVFVDKFFCQAGLPPFHTILGSPDAVNVAPPGSGQNKSGTRFKLSMEQIFEIRRRKRAGERTMVLAEEFGVSRRHINRI